MSVLGKKWEIKNTSEKSVIDKICENRGLSDPNDLTQFLEPDFEKDFHDPFLLPGMQKAVDRIKTAITNKERIMIYGDYDMDGISGTAIMFIALQKLGAEVSYRLPHRVNDGYGLSEKFVGEFDDVDVKLVITVDCGISNADEIAKLSQKGIDVIVTDHHTVPEKYPDAAYEVVHPLRADSKYPFKKLTGAGVAFKLVQALFGKDPFVYEILDLASLGTVADCGPIVGENRLIVKKGLEILPQTKWEGLKALLESAGVNTERPLNTFTIGYQIAPRINAAGRIDSPYHALQLLVKDDPKNLADKLETLNRKRQDMLKKAQEEAEKRYIENDDNFIIIDYDKNWHVGIIGLVAGKLAEKFNKPAIILQEFDDYMVASARSPEFFNIVEALAEHKEYLMHFGGHAQAAGFNIKKEKFEEFKPAISAYAKEKLSSCEIISRLPIDCEIKPDELNWETFEFIRSMEPYGIANERPTFLLKDAVIQHAKVVGKDEKHLSVYINKGGVNIRGIAFNFGEHAEYVRNQRSLDIVFQLDENEWKGKSSLQMKILDFS